MFAWNRLVLTIVVLPIISALQSCGTQLSSSSTRIIWGEAVSENEFQNVKAIILEDQTNATSNLLCTAIEISSTWYLTAAHCVEKFNSLSSANSDLKAFISNHGVPPKALDLEIDGPQNQKSEITEWHISPLRKNYPLGTQDIALVKISHQKCENSKPNTKIFAPLNSENLVNLKIELQKNSDSKAQIVGFGLDEFGNQGRKRKGFISKPSWHNPFELNSEAGPDACQGDSGGPLFFQDKLIGITSRGKSCGNGGIFTSIFPHQCWIANKLGIKLNQDQLNLCLNTSTENFNSKPVRFDEVLKLYKRSTNIQDFENFLAKHRYLDLSGFGITDLSGLDTVLEFEPKVIVNLNGNKIKQLEQNIYHEYLQRRILLSGNQITSSNGDSIDSIPGQSHNFKKTTFLVNCLNFEFSPFEQYFFNNMLKNEKLSSWTRQEKCQLVNERALFLEEIHLADSTFVDLDSLKDFSNLRLINLENTTITDQNFLMTLPLLSEIHLKYSALEKSLDMHLKMNLKTSGVELIETTAAERAFEFSELTNACTNSPESIFFKRISKNLENPKSSCKSKEFFLKTTDTLDVSESEINDLEYIDQLNHLETLNLSSTKIQDLGRLKRFQKLRYLKINDNYFSSLSSLTRLKNLETIEMKNTIVEDQDLEPLIASGITIIQ